MTKPNYESESRCSNFNQNTFKSLSKTNVINKTARCALKSTPPFLS